MSGVGAACPFCPDPSFNVVSLGLADWHFLQDLNNGAVLMQAYSDKAGILETLETG